MKTRQRIADMMKMQTALRLPAKETVREHYHPAFDGLRAIAAVSVFFWHYSGLPLGWAGVDLFFVLSGFLITGILFDSAHTDYRYRTFYIRRVLRIFPLYYAVLILVFLIEWLNRGVLDHALFMWPAYLGNYAQAFFPRKILQSVSGLEIGHLWTLSVEEQFYLIWPLVIYTVRSRQKLLKLCAGFVMVSPLLRLAALYMLPPRLLEADLVVRGTPFRIDALLIGAVAALLTRGPERAWLVWGAKPLLLTSAAFFVLCAVIARLGFNQSGITAHEPWVLTFGLTLLDLFSLGLVLACLDRNTLFARLCSLRPLRNFGKTSYGFYVFHLIPHSVLTAYRSILLGRGLSANRAQFLMLCAGFGLSWVLAAFSYRYFERPLIRLKDRWAPSAESAAVFAQSDQSFRPSASTA